ncbi:hypothetical protein CRUP_000014 [Coryphaenoides rupestris]|nr:hypothetical protein CRUP_000014 [Coryphaenoides rupestris]
MLMLIDTDCGIDDAQAVMMALAAPHVQVLGVTCCFGNAAVDNVCQNIPVFRGMDGPLVRADGLPNDHFGSDGLGDVLEGRDPDWRAKLQKEHAVTAMIRLVTEHPKQVSLVALGPLTNLALAVKLNPGFPDLLKDLFIMGGNMEGKGNVTVCGEFNFVCDPESAYIVLEEYRCPTHIATWEYCCRNKLTWEFFQEMLNQDYAAARFMKLLTSKCWAYSPTAMRNKRDVLFGPGFVSYDSYAMAACIDGSVVTKSVECGVRVELHGTMCRGMMALDPTDQLKKPHRVSVMVECDLEKFRKMLADSLKQP